MMKWDNLTSMQCPKCSANISDERNAMGYKCEECEFFVGYEKFQTLINNLMGSKEERRARIKYYDAEAVDRSGWD